MLKNVQLKDALAGEVAIPQITYEVAIAKLALCIQAEESPKSLYPAWTFSYHDVFFQSSREVHHRPGFLLRFLTGKHYKHCKKIHPIFVAALEGLHFQ